MVRFDDELVFFSLPGGCRASRSRASESPYPRRISSLHDLYIPQGRGVRTGWSVSNGGSSDVPSVHGSGQDLQSPVWSGTETVSSRFAICSVSVVWERTRLLSFRRVLAIVMPAKGPPQLRENQTGYQSRSSALGPFRPTHRCAGPVSVCRTSCSCVCRPASCENLKLNSIVYQTQSPSCRSCRIGNPPLLASRLLWLYSEPATPGSLIYASPYIGCHPAACIPRCYPSPYIRRTEWVECRRHQVSPILIVSSLLTLFCKCFLVCHRAFRLLNVWPLAVVDAFELQGLKPAVRFREEDRCKQGSENCSAHHDRVCIREHSLPLK